MHFFLWTSSARFLFDPLHDKQLSQPAGNWGMSAFLPSAMFPFPAYQFSLINKCRTHENSSKSALCGNHGNMWVARMIWDESVRKPEPVVFTHWLVHRWDEASWISVK